MRAIYPREKELCNARKECPFCRDNPSTGQSVGELVGLAGDVDRCDRRLVFPAPLEKLPRKEAEFGGSSASLVVDVGNDRGVVAFDANVAVPDQLSEMF